MNEIITVNFDTQTVSLRDLHQTLEIKERFSVWADRIKAVFEDELTSVGKPTVVNNGAERILEDYETSIDIAKHICLMSKTEKGKQCRQYLIDLEKAWNTPEQVMARALKIADQTIHTLSTQIAQLTPKAEYFDALVDRNLLTNIRDTAKELGVKERYFVKWLESKGYLYRDAYNNLKPFATYITGDKKYFEIKEFTKESGYSGVQTLVTPRGREAFRLLLSA